jgi:hypothetical protein
MDKARRHSSKQQWTAASDVKRKEEISGDGERNQASDVIDSLEKKMSGICEE